MIQVQLSALTVHDLVRRVKPIYEQIREGFDTANVPILDVYKEIAISPETSKTLFEYFPVQCEHFGSSDGFYSAVRTLNYFMTTYNYFMENRIDFTNMSLRSEDILILHTFLIFKDV